MASTYDRIETENSLLDEIIYNSKLIIQSIIIKDEAKALSYETKEMITNFDIYRAIKEGRISLYYFEDIELGSTLIMYMLCLKNINLFFLPIYQISL